MIHLPSLITGLSVGTCLGVVVVGMLRTDLQRARERLNEIIHFARRQDIEWTRRKMTGNDWNELVHIIQPYEDA